MSETPIMNIDYSHCDSLIHEIIETAAEYMKRDKSDIEKILFDTYLFARKAHE